MSKKDMLKGQIAITRMVIDGTMADVNPEQVMKAPGGTAHPIGATYAHSVLSEDAVINGMLRKQPMIATTDFEGKTGTSDPMPAFGEGGLYDWACDVKIDLPKVLEYAKAVHAQTDKYIDDLSDDDLSQKVEFGGMGQQSIADVITLIAIVHPSNHIGEISALKGVGGAKGYPF